MTLTRILQPEVKRDRWGRPVIGGRVYTRASSLSCDDKSGLITWKGQEVLRQVTSNRDLLDMEFGEAWKVIDNSGGASYGTAVHAVVEAIVHGEHIDAPDDVVADAQAALDVVDGLGLTFVASELFVVTDEVGAAGTLDMLLVDGDGNYLVGDLKTSSRDNAWKYSGLSWATQTAIYAHGKPLGPEGLPVDWEELGLKAPMLDESLVVQVVQRLAKAIPVACDLRLGWEAAQRAADLRDFRGRAFARPLL